MQLYAANKQHLSMSFLLLFSTRRALVTKTPLYSPAFGKIRASVNRQRHRCHRLASVALSSMLSMFRPTRTISLFSGATLTSAIVAAVASATDANALPPSWAPTADGDQSKLSALDMSDWLVESADASITVDVDVVLVGFHETDVDHVHQGEGESGGSGNGVILDEKTLERHFDALVEGLSTDGKGGVPLILVSVFRGTTALCILGYTFRRGYATFFFSHLCGFEAPGTVAGRLTMVVP